MRRERISQTPPRFYPAPGVRGNSEGTLYNVGNSGYNWSSTVTTSGNGYFLDFSYGGITPNATAGLAYGLQLRCLQE